MDRELMIRYFAEKLAVDRGTLRSYLENPSREFYDAEYYLSMVYTWHSISYDIIRELFLTSIPQKVHTALDIGCGPGLYTRLVRERAERYIGVDMSRPAVEMAKTIHTNDPNVLFFQGDARSVDTGEGPADLVFCSEVIEHITDDVSVLENFHNVLKPDGRIFLTTTTFYYYLAHVLVIFAYKDILLKGDVKRFFNRIKLFADGLKGSRQRSRFMQQGLDRNDHVHAYTYGQLKELCDKTGFTIQNYTYFNCKDIFPVKLFAPLNWALKKLFRTSKWYGPNIALLLSPR